jgi:hypothetical protein
VFWVCRSVLSMALTMAAYTLCKRAMTAWQHHVQSRLATRMEQAAVSFATHWFSRWSDTDLATPQLCSIPQDRLHQLQPAALSNHEQGPVSDEQRLTLILDSAPCLNGMASPSEHHFHSGHSPSQIASAGAFGENKSIVANSDVGSDSVLVDTEVAVSRRRLQVHVSLNHGAEFCRGANKFHEKWDVWHSRNSMP